jgi:Zn-dependent protease with chaperone function
MAPAARSFWRRYYLLTVLLPAYAQAVLYYGAAALTVRWLAVTSLASGTGGAPLAWSAGLLLGVIGLSRLLEMLALGLSGVRARAVPPGADEAQRLTALQANPDLPLLSPVLLELGAVPFLACGGPAQDELWISTHTLRATPEDQLQALVAHEQAHAALPPRRWDWAELSWLLAYPACWLAHDNVLWVCATAALHVSLWLRWRQGQIDRREAAADRSAAASVGREVYARALATNLGGAGLTPLLRRRLGAMGLSPAEVERLLVEFQELEIS